MREPFLGPYLGALWALLGLRCAVDCVQHNPPAARDSNLGCVCVRGCGVGQGPKTFCEPPGARPPARRLPSAAHLASVQVQERLVVFAKAQQAVAKAQ